MAASDFGKSVEGEAEVFGKEVSAELLLKTVEHTNKMVMGASEGLVVTGIADNDIAGLKGGDVGCLVDGVFKNVETLAVFGGDTN